MIRPNGFDAIVSGHTVHGQYVIREGESYHSFWIDEIRIRNAEDWRRALLRLADELQAMSERILDDRF